MMVISTTSIAPVGSVLPRSSSPTSRLRFAAMMPEPTTVATRSAVPTTSAVRRRGRSKAMINRLWSGQKMRLPSGRSRAIWL